MIEVRDATDGDIPWVMECLRELSEWYGTKRRLFGDEDYAREGLAGLIRDHLVKVAMRDGKPAGLIAGTLTPHPLNPKIRILAELFWWVQDGPERPRIGMMLMDEFVGFGIENADWITFSLKDIQPVGRWALERRGFRLQERVYLREVPAVVGGE